MSELQFTIAVGTTNCPKKTPAYLIPFEKSEGNIKIMLGIKVTKAYWFHECIPWMKGWRKVSSNNNRDFYVYRNGNDIIRNPGYLVPVGGTTREDIPVEQLTQNEFEEETGLKPSTISVVNTIYFQGEQDSKLLCFYGFILLVL
jgi:hypothetical protein